MTKSQLEKYRKQLLELSSDVRANLTDVTEQAQQPTSGQTAGGLSNAPYHLGDVGTETYLQELNSTLMETEQSLAGEVSAALQRIDDGSFGICELCGQEIPTARLDALPYTAYCVKCSETASTEPRPNLNAGRPRGPQDTLGKEGTPGLRKDDRRDQSVSGQRPLPDSAIGTAGGGTASGGLAGTNSGHGDPEDVDLERATASGQFKPESDDSETAYSGLSGGAVGGTPAGKRARGGRTADAE